MTAYTHPPRASGIVDAEGEAPAWLDTHSSPVAPDCAHPFHFDLWTLLMLNGELQLGL
jgi:hypothetical protein